MATRDWNPEDAEKIREFHDSLNLGYHFPNVASPLFCIKRLVEDEKGIAAGGAIKLFGEAFLWVSPWRSTDEKKSAMHELSGEMRQEAVKIGLDELSAWIPPQIERGFSPELLNMHWRPSPWRSWSTVLP